MFRLLEGAAQLILTGRFPLAETAVGDQARMFCLVCLFSTEVEIGVEQQLAVTSLAFSETDFNREPLTTGIANCFVKVERMLRTLPDGGLE